MKYIYIDNRQLHPFRISKYQVDVMYNVWISLPNLKCFHCKHDEKPKVKNLIQSSFKMYKEPKWNNSVSSSLFGCLGFARDTFSFCLFYRCLHVRFRIRIYLIQRFGSNGDGDFELWIVSVNLKKKKFFIVRFTPVNNAKTSTPNYYRILFL